MFALLRALYNLFFGPRKFKGEEVIPSSTNPRKPRLFYCLGHSPSDNNEHYFHEGLHPGEWVEIAGKPGKPTRRPKQAVYRGILKRRYRGEVWISLISTSGQKFRRRESDLLGKA